MRKDFGAKTWFYPLPVLIVGTYDENGNAMNVAWGGVYDTNQVILSLSADHKTTKNIRTKEAFTISFGDLAHVVACGYVGLVSGNKEQNKLEKAGFTTEKSKFVDAPIIRELPMTLECRLVKINEDGSIIGEIVNISIDESILGEDGLVDVTILQPISYDPVHDDYIVLGEKVGRAFHDGNALRSK